MEALKQYLDREKISQSAFAETLGVTQGAVSRWLAGAAPKRKLMVKIENATHGAVPIASWFPAREGAA